MTITDALNKIIADAPEFAGQAQAILERPDGAYRVRAAQRLFALVLSSESLTMDARAQIAKLLGNRTGGKKTAVIPAIRCTEEEYNILCQEADSANVRLTDYVRMKLFGN